MDVLLVLCIHTYLGFVRTSLLTGPPCLAPPWRLAAILGHLRPWLLFFRGAEIQCHPFPLRRHAFRNQEPIFSPYNFPYPPPSSWDFLDSDVMRCVITARDM